ncbi:G-protein coupled receptors family 1 profile domain-containing protein [Plasmodiophora brassicae]
MKTATYRHANTSFSITAPLHFVDGSDPASLGSEVSGTVIVVDYDAYSNTFAWASACQSRGCLGMAMVTTNWAPIASLYAWVESDKTASPREQRSTLPIVILDGLDALTSMNDVVRRHRSGPITAVVDASDILEGTSASAMFANPAAIAALAIAWLINVVNMAASAYKLAAFAIDRQGKVRAVPLYPAIVFTTVLVSSTIRTLWLTDAAFYSLQAFSRPLYRILLTSFIPVTFASTAAIGMAMHDHLMQGKTVSTRHQVAMRLLLCVVGTVFTVDVIATFTAALTWQEYFSSTYFSLFYFLMNIPVSVLFMRYGSMVSTELLRNTTISTRERTRSLQFARRVAISGAIGIVVLVSQVVFTILNMRSVSYYILLYTLAITLNAIQCSTFISAFRTRSSIVHVVSQAFMPRSCVRASSTSDDRPKDAVKVAPAPSMVASDHKAISIAM